MDFTALDMQCNGLFLIIDTAVHNGFRPSEKEVRKHIKECRECFDRNGEHI